MNATPLDSQLYRPVTSPDAIIIPGDEYDRHGDPEAWRPGWATFSGPDIGRRAAYFRGWSIRRPVRAGIGQQAVDLVEALKDSRLSTAQREWVVQQTLDAVRALGRQQGRNDPPPEVNDFEG